MTFSTETAVPAGTSRLFLRSYEGLAQHLVSNAPPRDCTPEEIPTISLDRMQGDLDARKALAREILQAAETSGFFYIKNHGIPESVISDTIQKSKSFFDLPVEIKKKAATTASSYGYHGLRTRQAHQDSSKDRKEVFKFHYKPEFDPMHEGSLAKVPSKVRDHIPQDDSIWTPTGVDGFHEALITHWQACLSLARGLIRILALALDLPEDYFDAYTTYPGADFGVNLYPGHGEDAVEDPDEVGVGAHTDLQILTLLWQDKKKGLQILNNKNEWVIAPPIPGTMVVNIGDFLMRLTNNRLKSTVHRVIQHGKEDRFSIPFFFGFNFDEKLGVVPTCVDDAHPAKYQPETCGDLISRRLAQGER